MAKVMVSLPEQLLQRIDEEAKRRGTTRSGLLQTAARRELGDRDITDMWAAVERSRVLFKGSGGFDSARLIREERDRLDRRSG
ncbi:MAG TPA: type II toxin-antitoxin system HicB family antitoxin [Chloroflexota bacterium]|nr:type II toxin-antitoxin system HicB family antitoxin [Chloroflexota bacterium]